MKTFILAAICLLFSYASGASSEEVLTGTITGKILGKNGESLSGGKVVLFRAESGPVPSHTHYWRIPDEIVDINDDSAFAANLAEGKYFLAAIRKSTNESIGPPQEGDLIYPFRRKDLKASQESYIVSKGTNTNVGVIAEAVPFKMDPVGSDTRITSIQGTVRDTQGNPVSDGIVFAYLKPKFTGKPLFSSDRTGKDGKYSLRVSEGGRYYIKTRNTREAGHPNEGEIIGVYGNDAPLAVSVRTGETTTGIDVVGKQFVKQKSNGSSKMKSWGSL